MFLIAVHLYPLATANNNIRRHFESHNAPRRTNSQTVAQRLRRQEPSSSGCMTANRLNEVHYRRLLGATISV